LYDVVMDTARIFLTPSETYFVVDQMLRVQY
jgi:hypothetical protein